MGWGGRSEHSNWSLITGQRACVSGVSKDAQHQRMITRENQAGPAGEQVKWPRSWGCPRASGSLCVSDGEAPGGTRRPRSTVRKNMEPGVLTETQVCLTVHNRDLYQQLDCGCGPCG